MKARQVAGITVILLGVLGPLIYLFDTFGMSTVPADQLTTSQVVQLLGALGVIFIACTVGARLAVSTGSSLLEVVEQVTELSSPRRTKSARHA